MRIKLDEAKNGRPIKRYHFVIDFLKIYISIPP